MTQYILDTATWRDAVTLTQDPANTIRTISLANNIIFTSMDQIYGHGGFPGQLLMTLRRGQIFEGNGFTITIDAPPYDGIIGIQGLFSLNVVLPGRCTIRNLKIILTERSMIGNPDNPYSADSPLVAYNLSLRPQGLVCENIVVETNALLTEGCCLMHGANNPSEADGCFIRIGSATTEAAPSEFFHPMVFVFSMMPEIMRNCAFVSNHDMRTFYPSLSASSDKADVSGLYVDLSIQTVIPFFPGPPPSVLTVLLADVSGPLNINGSWIWWGNPNEPAIASLVDTAGYYDIFDDPVPGNLVISNTATNIHQAVRHIVVGNVVIGSNVQLSLTDWTTFPILTGAFDYTFNPPVLRTFREYPFYAQAIISAISLPQFAIPLCVIQFIDGIFWVRATAAVGSILDLSYPLSYWVQGGEDSNSTTEADDSPWTILPDNQRESRPVAVISPHTPHPKLQMGLTTFNFPGVPQYYFFSIPLPNPPACTVISPIIL